MPGRRAGRTTAVTIGGEQFHITASADSGGALGEVFIRWNKHGSTAAGLIDGYATALSLGLAYRVPLASLLRHGLNLRFSPAGRTDDPDIPTTASIADYIARRLALDWLPYAERAELGIHTLAERLQTAPAWSVDHAYVTPTAYATAQN
jgi:ribonucleoside-diphosphate reductase alpha chain